MNRQSLQHDAKLAGLGLFTQTHCNLRIRPAPAHHSVVFVRTDLPRAKPIEATIANLSTDPIHHAFASIPPRHTNLCNNDTCNNDTNSATVATVATVEHLLSALVGLGITDALIEMDSPEVPIFDGSASPFVDAITQAGIQTLDTTIEPIVLHETITVHSGDSWIKAQPCDADGSYTYELDYTNQQSAPHAAPIGSQSATWTGGPDAYTDQIAPARTFSLEHEAKAMQSLGLFAAFTPADLLVIGPGGPIDNAWRFDNEPARHKLLDLIGDLSLAGAPIRAHITAHKSGHALNHELARRLAQLINAD